MIIDLEAQGKPRPSYWLESRGIAYCARQISEQFGRNVTHGHYENLQKVYSIWIVMNSSQEDANTVSEYGITQRSAIGKYNKNPRIDLLSVVMIRLPKDEEWNKAKNPATRLTQMLATLLSSKIQPAEKIEAMEKNYGIEATEEIREEVNEMCNYSSAVADNKAKDVAEKMIRGNEPDWKIIEYTGLTQKQVKDLREEMKKAVM